MSSEEGSRIDVESIALCEPTLRGNEWKYVKECLDTGWVSSSGSFVSRFEREVAAYVDRKHGVATVNGTAALHIALQIAGIEPEDEVLVSALSFVAPANAIHYLGARPVFIDSEPKYWQMDVELALDFLDKQCVWRDGRLRNRLTGRRVRAILPVHILGHPVDLDPLIEAAAKFDLPIIEDATESLCARYRGHAVGALGSLAAFSFNGNKLITSGGGGMIVCDDEDDARRARYLTTQAKDDPVEYIHNEVGYNYRLTNIQAALGCAQLELADDFVAAKRKIASMYSSRLQDVPGIHTMREAPWAESAYWLYTVVVDEQDFRMTRRELMTHLASSGIQTRPLWHPLHRLPVYKDDLSCGGEVASTLHDHSLSLPSSVSLVDHPEAIEYIVDRIVECG